MQPALTVLIGCAGLAILVVASAGVMLFLRARSSADVGPALTGMNARINELEESWASYLRRQAGRNRHQKGTPADIIDEEETPPSAGRVTGLRFKTPPGSSPEREPDPSTRREALRRAILRNNGGIS